MADAKRVLVVDDSDVVARMVTQVIEEDGFQVLRARDGVEGVLAAYREAPDLIIMDVEMPLMQGYQASRLLKNRRGVRDIPIIMHTSHSEDREKYWALTSGADAFESKDFDNLEGLLGKVRSMADHAPLDRELIREDGSSLTKDRIVEMLGSIFDQHLFQSTILNLLGDVGRSISSLSETALKVLTLVAKVTEYDLACLLVKFEKKPLAFIVAGPNVPAQSVDEFMSICLGDFYPHFPSLSLEETERVVFGMEESNDSAGAHREKRTINSYGVFPLTGKGDTVIGTIHVGSFANNLFPERVSANMRIFAAGAGMVVENAVLFNQVSEMQQRVRTVFAKFVPAEIIDELVEKRAEAHRVVGEKRVVAVLFSDIRSFAKISEENSAEVVVGFLNSYLDIMVKIIRKHGGTIDKFIGDAILAVFGAPRSHPDNARRAVLAASEMVASLKDVRVDGLKLPEDGLDSGVGIHEGPAIVGTIGSEDTFSYTVIGDTVNLASRLESLTKYYNRKIIVSDAVRASAGEVALFRAVDTVRVKGKDEPTRLYAVETETDLFGAQFMDPYDKGMKMYTMGSWTTALEYFQKAHAVLPDEPVTNLLLERCARYREDPPPQWDGAQHLDFK